MTEGKYTLVFWAKDFIKTRVGLFETLSFISMHFSVVEKRLPMHTMVWNGLFHIFQFEILNCNTKSCAKRKMLRKKSSYLQRAAHLIRNIKYIAKIHYFFSGVM